MSRKIDFKNYKDIMEVLNEDNVAFANLEYTGQDTQETFKNKLIDSMLELIENGQGGDIQNIRIESEHELEELEEGEMTELERVVDELIKENSLYMGIYDIYGVDGGDLTLMRIEDIIALEIKFGEHDFDYAHNINMRIRQDYAKELLIELGFIESEE